jgi:hypothetical protein
LARDVYLASEQCDRAWQTRFPGRRGIPLVNARLFVDARATYGASPPGPRRLTVASRRPGSGERGDDLCGWPTRLSAADVSPSFVVMVDQSRLGSAGDKSKRLAHELGHNLLLGHGNGLDDNRDGRAVGVRGPRRYGTCQTG